MTVLFSQQGLGAANFLGEQQRAQLQGQIANTGFSKLNLANGNLVISRQDEWLVNRGSTAFWQSTYNSQGQLGDVWDTFSLDKIQLENGRPVRILGDGSRQVFSAEADANVWTSTDGAGAHDRLEFDSSSRQWSFVEGGKTITSTFNEAGQLISRFNSAGEGWQFHYQDGQLHSVESESGTRYLLSYEMVAGSQRLTALKTQAASDASILTQVRYGYDELGRLVSVEHDLTPEDNSVLDGDTYHIHYAYEGDSQRIRQVATSDGRLTQIRYQQILDSDAPAHMQGQFVVSELIEGQSLHMSIDYNFKLKETTVTNGLGETTRYRYDQLSRLISQSLPLQNGSQQTFQYRYDDDDNLIEKIDGNGFSTFYEFDDHGNLIQEWNSAGVTTKMTYNESQQLVSKSQFTGLDPDGPGQTQADGETMERWFYNDKNQLRFFVGELGQVEEYRYNDWGLSTETLSYQQALSTSERNENLNLAFLENWQNSQNHGIASVQRDYNLDGSLAKQYHYSDSVLDKTEAFIYDAQGNLLSQQVNDQVASTYVYDGIGRLLSHSKGEATTLYTYGANSQHQSTLHPNGKTSSKTFNAAGLLIHSEVSIDDNISASKTQYWYDAKGQLRAKENENGEKSQYFYDVAGNRVGELNEMGQLTTAQFDGNGQVKQKTRHDFQFHHADFPEGHLVDANLTAWQLDHYLNQITENPQPQSASQNEFYFYDSVGRLRFAVNSLGEVTESVYNGKNELVRVAQWSTAVDLAVVNSEQTAESFYAAVTGQHVATIENQSFFIEQAPNNDFLITERTAIERTSSRSIEASGTATATLETISPFQPYPVSEAAIIYVQGDNQRYTQTAQNFRLDDTTQRVTLPAEALQFAQVRVSYRLAGDNADYQVATTEYSADQAFVQLSQLELTRDYEIRVDYFDAQGELWDSGIGAFRHSEYQTEGNFELVFNRADIQAEVVSGTRLMGVIDSSLQTSDIAEIVSTVYETPYSDLVTDLADLRYISEAITLPQHEINYDGGINLSTDALLASARYQIHTTIRYTDGRLVELPAFITEIGAQPTGKLSQAFSLPLSDFPASDIVTVGFRNPEDSAEFIEVPFALVNGELKFNLSNLSVDQAYEIQIRGQLADDARSTLATNFYFDAGSNGAINYQWQLATAESVVTDGYAIENALTDIDTQGLDRILADIYDDNGQWLARAVTLPQLHLDNGSYNGHLNLATEQTLDGERVHVEVSLVYNNGQRVDTQRLENIELGIQKVEQTPTVVTLPNSFLEQANEWYFSFPSQSYSEPQRLALSVDRSGNGQFTLNDLLGLTSADKVPDGYYQVRLQSNNDSNNETAFFDLGIVAGSGTSQVIIEDLNDTASYAVDAIHTHFYFDDAGRKIGELDADGFFKSWDYNSQGQIVESKYFANHSGYRGEQVNETFDAIKDRVGSSSEDRVEQQIYDARGRVIAVRDGAGYVTAYSYNGSDQVEKVWQFYRPIAGELNQSIVDQAIDAENFRLSEKHYDSQGRIISESNGLGLETRYSYSDTGELIAIDKVAANENRSVLHRYDQLGRVIATLEGEGVALLEQTNDTSAKNQVWERHGSSYEYDSEGQRVASHRWQQLEVGSEWVRITDRTFYQEDGKVQLTVSGTGQVSEYFYDHLGRQQALVQYATAIDTALVDSHTTVGDLKALITTHEADRWTTFQFDQLNRQTQVSDARGQTQTFTYNRLGQKIREVLYLDAQKNTSRSTNYAYDNRGNTLASYYDGEFAQVKNQWEYNAFGEVVKSIDQWQNATTRDYDQRGNLIRVTHGDNSSELTYFDAFSRAIKTVDRNGVNTDIIFDDEKLTVERHFSNGSVISQTRNAYGEVIESRNADQSQVRYNFNLDGQLVSKEAWDANNQLLETDEIATYNSQGLLLSESFANGTTLSYHYDQAGRVITEVLSGEGLSQTSHFEYNSFGEMTKSIDGSGTTKRYRFDKGGNTLSETVTNTNGRILEEARFHYDLDGKLIRSERVLANGKLADVVVFEYDNLGRKIKETRDPDGLAITQQSFYDNAGRVYQDTDALGNSNWTVYDAEGMNRILYTIDSIGSVTEFEYDSSGRMIREIQYAQTIVTDDLTEQMQSYFEQGDDNVYRLIEQKLATRVGATGDDYQVGGQQNELNRVQHYAYNEKGNQIATVSPGGTVSRYVYDLNDRLVQTLVFPDVIEDESLVAGTRTLSQDDLTPYKMEAGDNVRVTSLVFDALGREVATISPMGQVLVKQFNDQNEVVATHQLSETVDTDKLWSQSELLTLMENDGQKRSQHHFYDGLGRLSFTLDSQRHLEQYNYDEANNLIETRRFSETYTGNEPSQAQLETWASNQSYREYGSRFDGLGRKVADYDGSGRVRLYSYNAANQLEHEASIATRFAPQGALSFDEFIASHGLSEVDNGLFIQYEYDTAGRVITKSKNLGWTERYRYDALGQQTAVINALGQESLFEYDARGLMIKSFEAVNDSQGQLSEYEHDAFGQQTRSHRYATLVTRGTGQAIEELQGSYDPESDRITRQYFDHSGRITSSIETVYRDGEAQESIDFMRYDAFNNRIAIVEAAGSLDERQTLFEYDAQNREVSVTLAAGSKAEAKSEKVYNAFGELIQETDARGVELAERDSAWAMQERFELGFVIDDGGSQRAKLSEELNASEKHQLRQRYTRTTYYLHEQKVLRHQNALGEVTTEIRNGFGELVEQVDAMSNSTFKVYYADGQVAIEIDKRGYASLFLYDEHGEVSLLQRFTKPLNLETLNNVADVNSWQQQIEAIADQSSFVTKTVRNELGQVTEVITADGHSTYYTYDLLGNTTSMTNKRGFTTHYEYDAKGRKIKETAPAVSIVTDVNAGTVQNLAIETHFEYDAFGNLIRQVDAVGTSAERTQRFAYDNLSRQIEVNKGSLHVYDPETKSYQVINDITTTHYDMRGNKIETIYADGSNETAFYNELDHVIARVDVRGTLTAMTYDALGNVTSQAQSDTKINDKSSRTNLEQFAATADQQVRYFEYDTESRLVREWQDAFLSFNVDTGLLQTQAEIHHGYDKNGNKRYVTDALGNHHWTFSNEIGQVALEINADRAVIAYEYDSLGNAIKETRYSDRLSETHFSELDTDTTIAAVKAWLQTSSTDRVLEKRYDAMNRVIEERLVDVEVGELLGTGENQRAVERKYTLVTELSYDAQGNIVKIEKGSRRILGSREIPIGEKRTVTLSYDAQDRKIEESRTQRLTEDGLTITPRTLTRYDHFGNSVLEVEDNQLEGQQRKIDDSDRTTRFEYDSSGRLKTETRVDGHKIHYAYNSKGQATYVYQNRTQASYNDNHSVDYSEVLVENFYHYDEAGNQVKHERDDGSYEFWRYNTQGQVIAQGKNGYVNQEVIYNRHGHVEGTFAGGRETRHLQDAAGNSTLTLKSSGADLLQRDLATVLSESYANAGAGIDITMTQYDAMGRVVATLVPDLDFLKTEGASAPVVNLTEDTQFADTLVKAEAGFDLRVNFDLNAFAYNRSKPAVLYRQESVRFFLNGAQQSQKPLKLIWDTGFSYATRGVSYLSGSFDAHTHYFMPRGHGIEAKGKTTSNNLANRGFIYEVKVMEQQDDNSWSLIKTFDGSYGWKGDAPGIKKRKDQTTELEHHSVPPRLTLGEQPEDAIRVEWYSRPSGSVQAFEVVDAGKNEKGEFVVDVSHLNNNALAQEFDVYFLSFDAAGRVVNGGEGSLGFRSGRPIIDKMTGLTVEAAAARSLENLTQQSIDTLKEHAIYDLQRYNAFGEVIKKENASGDVTHFHFNKQGQLVREEKPETDVTLENGFIERSTPTERYVYDAFGRKIATQDANENWRFAEWTGDVMTAQTDALGHSKTFGYDQWNQKVSQTDELGNTTRYEHNALGQVTLVDRAGVLDDRYRYDELGQRIVHESAYRIAGQGRIGIAITQYDALNRATYTRGFNQRETRWAYTLESGGFLYKTTTRHDGTQLKDKIDRFGRLVEHTDAGGHVTWNDYDEHSGFKLRQTNSLGQDIVSNYYRNGMIERESDLATNRFSFYSYNNRGQLAQERHSYLDADGTRQYTQDTAIQYDELGRRSRIVDSKFSTAYEYDAVGNRRAVHAEYEQIDGTWKSQSNWYLYDKENRFTLTQGRLFGGRGDDADDSSSRIITLLGTGRKVTYDAVGRRKTLRFGGTVERYEYNDYGWLTQMYVNNQKALDRFYGQDGSLTRSFEYYVPPAPTVRPQTWRAWRDARLPQRLSELQLETVFEPVERPLPPSRPTKRAKMTLYHYDSLGNVSRRIENNFDRDGTVDRKSTTTMDYDLMGNILTSVSKDDQKQDNGDWTDQTVTTQYAYELWDNYKQKSIRVSATTTGELRYNWAPGLSQLDYDINGNLVRAIDQQGGRVIDYINTGEGKVLTRVEQAGSSTKNQRYYYVGGVEVGDVGDNGPSYRDYATVLRKSQVEPPEKPVPYKNENSADFDANFTPISSGSGMGRGYYTVNRGDTLSRLAQNLWGNANLWYLIADANGITADNQLSEGMVLVIPNTVSANTQNTSETFRPYNSQKATGDVDPTLPERPPLPVPPKKSCNPLAAIVMIVVTVVATVFTAGAAALAMSGGWSAVAGAGLSGIMSAGTVALAGGAAAAGALGMAVTGAAASIGVTAAIVGAAVGGFMGSVMGQLVGKAMGIVDSFSLRQAAAAGLTSAASAGIGAYMTGASSAKVASDVKDTQEKISQITKALNYVQTAATKATLNYAAGQAANKIAGLETNESKGGLLAAITTQIATGTGSMPWEQSSELATNLFNTAVSATAKRLFDNGGEQDWAQIAVTAIGNTLANKIVAYLQEPPTQDYKEEVAEKYTSQKPKIEEKPPEAKPEPAPTFKPPKKPKVEDKKPPVVTPPKKPTPQKSKPKEAEPDLINKKTIGGPKTNNVNYTKNKNGVYQRRNDKGQFASSPTSKKMLKESIKESQFDFAADVNVVKGEFFEPIQERKALVEGLDNALVLEGEVSGTYAAKFKPDAFEVGANLKARGSFVWAADKYDSVLGFDSVTASLDVSSTAETNLDAKFALSKKSVQVKLDGKAEVVAFQASGSVTVDKIDLGLFVLDKTTLAGDANALGAGIAGTVQAEYKNGKFKFKLGAGATLGIGARGQISTEIQLAPRVTAFIDQVQSLGETANKAFRALNDAFDWF